MQKTVLVPLALFLVAFVGYTAIARMTFKMPATVSEGAGCDFTPGDFTQSGQLRYSENEAWWIAFLRKQDYLSSFSVGMAFAFAGYSLIKMRQIGAKAASGGVAGSGLLVGLTLCFSCLAPVFAAVGVGLFANFGLALVAIPKWLVALNTLGLTSYGFLYVSRKATCCPLVPHGSSAISAQGEIAR